MTAKCAENLKGKLSIKTQHILEKLLLKKSLNKKSTLVYGNYNYRYDETLCF